MNVQSLCWSRWLCMHKVLSGICSSVQWSSSNGTVWKSSSILSSSSCCRCTGVVEWHPSAGIFEVSLWPGVVDVVASSSEMSSQELYVSHLQMGLRWGSLEVHDGTGVGLNEAFSALDTWCIFAVLWSGVGMLKFSDPLSYPSSSSASLCSKVAFREVTKWQNGVLSDCQWSV